MKYEPSYKLNEDDSIILNVLTQNTYKCKCGHSVIIIKEDKALCKNCGKWVFKDKEKEFKYRVKEQLTKQKG